MSIDDESDRHLGDNYPFIRYPHLVKVGHDEVSDFFETPGPVYVFPKLDGSNGCFWYDSDQYVLRAGSRNRELSLDRDNHGFLAHAATDPRFRRCAYNAPSCIFYGEWLVPHTFKGYRPEAWRQFWIFDVYQRGFGFLPFRDALPLVRPYGLEILDPIAVLPDGRLDDALLTRLLESNRFLVADDCREPGEGLVFKRYDGWRNKFGRVQWPKAVRGEFKDAHVREMGPQVANGEIRVEQKIAEAAVTRDLVAKEGMKLAVGRALDGQLNTLQSMWSSALIPALLGRVYHCVVTEELWDQLKRHKQPTIDFKLLNREVVRRVKAVAPELF